MSADVEDKPPPPPVRYGSSREQQTFFDLKSKPLPKEPNANDHGYPSSRSANSDEFPSNQSVGTGGGFDFGIKKKKDKIKNFAKKKDKDKLPDKPEISLPSNFAHKLHVGFDPSTGEFTGMILLFCV